MLATYSEEQTHKLNDGQERTGRQSQFSCTKSA